MTLQSGPLGAMSNGLDNSAAVPGGRTTHGGAANGARSSSKTAPPRLEGVDDEDDTALFKVDDISNAARKSLAHKLHGYISLHDFS